MNNHDEYSGVWLEKLDSIVAGESVPSANDDELLPIAARLTAALAPLREMDDSANVRRQRLSVHLYVKYTKIMASTPGVTTFHTHRLSRYALLVAALLLMVLIVSMMSSGGLIALRGNAAQVWHASTSLDQIKGLSLASLSPPHAGVKPLPLLPTALPPDTQASSYGVITDTSNPHILATFVADYRISGQDVLLYEQPSDIPFTSSTAKTVHIGMIEGQLFHDNAGTNALQWYQHAMLCQVTSKLSVERLIALASTFQPIQNWDLLL